MASYQHDQSAGDLTLLLRQWSDGDEAARDELLRHLYVEIQNIAASQLARESPGHTLQPDALVNETYLKLGAAKAIDWKSRTHFKAVLARMMRQILVDHGRHKQVRRRTAQDCITLSVDLKQQQNQIVDLIALDDALKRLKQLNAQHAQVVELRFFGDLTIEETAEALDLSVATVNRCWSAARVWLYQTLNTK